MTQPIIYKINHPLIVSQVAAVFDNSGIKRPTNDLPRIQQMIDKADLIVTAWDGEMLVGIARSLTDFVYCCYLSDLAVQEEYQHKGIGKKLIEITKEQIGDQSMLLLLSAAPAMEYYPKLNLFEKVDNGFIIKRKS